MLPLARSQSPTPSAMRPSVFVVIPTHGRAPLLGRTLGSLAACSQPDGYRETIVVENGRPSGSERIVREVRRTHPHLRLTYLHASRANKSAALNAALEHIPNDDGLVVFFDDDVRLSPGVLCAYEEAYAEAGELSYFGGPVSCDYDEAPPAWLVPVLPHSARGYELDDRGTMTGEFLGFNWAAPLGALRTAEGFNPQVGPGSPTGARGQETEMQRRLREQGLRPVDVEAARVWHYVPPERSSLRWLVSRRVEMGRSLAVTSRPPPSKALTASHLARSTLSLGKRLALLDRAGAAVALHNVAYNVGVLQASLRRSEAAMRVH